LPSFSSEFDFKYDQKVDSVDVEKTFGILDYVYKPVVVIKSSNVKKVCRFIINSMNFLF